MSEDHPSRSELARQVIVGLAAGLAAGYAGPAAGTVAVGAAPVVLAGMDYISATIGSRRREHATETLTDAADEFGAQTPEEFVEFIKAAVSDEEHQELLAHALTIAQDTAMRDKRRALGRALASAASDTGTKVDDELLFIRAVADIDAMHIRLLRLMATAVQPRPPGWSASRVLAADPGLANGVYALLGTLEQHGLIVAAVPTAPIVGPGAGQNYYNVTEPGRRFLDRLADETN